MLTLPPHHIALPTASLLILLTQSLQLKHADTRFRPVPVLATEKMKMKCSLQKILRVKSHSLLQGGLSPVLNQFPSNELL